MATAADDRRIDHGHREQPLRLSLPGVQLKFSVLEEYRRGLTIPAEGIGGSWIVNWRSSSAWTYQRSAPGIRLEN